MRIGCRGSAHRPPGRASDVDYLQELFVADPAALAAVRGACRGGSGSWHGTVRLASETLLGWLNVGDEDAARGLWHDVYVYSVMDPVAHEEAYIVSQSDATERGERHRRHRMSPLAIQHVAGSMASCRRNDTTCTCHGRLHMPWQADCLKRSTCPSTREGGTRESGTCLFISMGALHACIISRGRTALSVQALEHDLRSLCLPSPSPYPYPYPSLCIRSADLHAP